MDVQLDVPEMIGTFGLYKYYIIKDSEKMIKQFTANMSFLDEQILCSFIVFFLFILEQVLAIRKKNKQEKSGLKYS